MCLQIKKKHCMHLLQSQNKVHSSLSFSQCYTEQKINVACPYHCDKIYWLGERPEQLKIQAKPKKKRTIKQIKQAKQLQCAPPLSADGEGEGRVEPLTKFSRRGGCGLARPQLLEGGCQKRRESFFKGDCSFYIKIN